MRLRRLPDYRASSCGSRRSSGALLVAISYVIHDISALIMLFGIFFHIYLSTFGEPGTIQAMTRGTVSEGLGLDASSCVVQSSHRSRSRRSAGGGQAPHIPPVQPPPTLLTAR